MPTRQEYKEVFEPLLLEEAGAQVLRGMEEGYVLEPHEAVVAACTTVRVLCVRVRACALCVCVCMSGGGGWMVGGDGR
jgi:hypothetical protein